MRDGVISIQRHQSAPPDYGCIWWFMSVHDLRSLSVLESALVLTPSGDIARAYCRKGAQNDGAANRVRSNMTRRESGSMYRMLP